MMLNQLYTLCLVSMNVCVSVCLFRWFFYFTRPLLACWTRSGVKKLSARVKNAHPSFQITLPVSCVVFLIVLSLKIAPDDVSCYVFHWKLFSSRIPSHAKITVFLFWPLPLRPLTLTFLSAFLWGSFCRALFLSFSLSPLFLSFSSLSLFLSCTSPPRKKHL